MHTCKRLGKDKYWQSLLFIFKVAFWDYKYVCFNFKLLFKQGLFDFLVGKKGYVNYFGGEGDRGDEDS